MTEIPDPATGVCPSRSYPLQYTSRIVTSLRRKFIDNKSPSKPYMIQHPWRDNTTSLMYQAFPSETLRRSQSTIRSSPFLDWNGVLDCYRSHLNGDQRNTELIQLLGLLEMPLFDEIGDSVSS